MVCPRETHYETDEVHIYETIPQERSKESPVFDDISEVGFNENENATTIVEFSLNMPHCLTFPYGTILRNSENPTVKTFSLMS